MICHKMPVLFLHIEDTNLTAMGGIFMTIGEAKFAS